MADYSQLELRVLAHLSNDARLLAILNSRDGDVFDSIARQWRSVLGPVERQKVKQVIISHSDICFSLTRIN